MKTKEKEMNSIFNIPSTRIFSVAAFIVALSIVCFTVYMISVTEKTLMSKNIENAIGKGIDPIAVRCAYASGTDNVCLAYSITHNTVDAPPAPPLARK